LATRYSSNQDISRARQAFFAGNKSFLLVSERFHFFRRFDFARKNPSANEFAKLSLSLDPPPFISFCRYKIRGIRNLIFYGPPDHPQFFSEFLSFPFLDDGVDASDVTCRVLYSKYDFFRMERIVGTKEAVAMVSAI
jgi:U3 small nucleolar RNA-associated protein 25